MIFALAFVPASRTPPAAGSRAYPVHLRKELYTRIVISFSTPLKTASAMLALATILLTPQSAQAQNLLDTASPTVAEGSQVDGWDLDTQWLGASFTTTQDYTVTQLGFNGGVNSGSIFLALVPATTLPGGICDTPDLPVDYTLSDAVYHTSFTSPAVNTDVSATTNFLLPAGTYDLIAGSGAFGTSGQGFVTQFESVNGIPTFVVGEPASALGGSGSAETFYSETTSTNFTGRFFVSGVPATVPEASATVSFSLLLALDLGGVVMAHKKRAVA